jgi:hypothetical protein
MDRRAPERALIAVTAAVCLAGCGGKPRLAVGDPVARLGLHALPGETSVVWVVRDRDLFSCRNAARALRHLQARGDVRIAIIAVGRDEAVLPRFLLAQRLSAQVSRVDAKTFRDRYGELPLPALLVARGGRVTAEWAAAREVIAATDGEAEALFEAAAR